jgi:Ion channel
VLVLVAAAGIARGIGAQPVIDRHTIAGAVAIYLIVGLTYAYIYATIAAFGDPQFFAGDREDTIANFLYFSYVTQSTVGYGDFVAATQLGRTFAVTEALLGQLYLVTVVAVVVSNIGRERRRRAVT